MATKTSERMRAALSAATGTRLTDRELLTRFVDGDESAFAAIVQRHTGMVLGVCARMLQTVQDAEDACQATFLVLARKAKSGRWQSSVANWLYTTARRIAFNASRAAARRAKRESSRAPLEAISLLDQMTGREAFAVLDEELDKLPTIYREPLVLCYLQGLARDEAAARLGIPSGTLKSQLERGRKRLADALTKRGIALGAGLLAVVATSSARASSPKLIESILGNLGGPLSASVATLAKGVGVNGILSQATCIVLAALAVAVTGFGLVSMPIAAGPQRPATDKSAQQPAKPNAPSEDKPEAEAKNRTISGKVFGADGKPIAATLTLVWMEGDPQSLGKTDADGSFRITVPLKSKEYGGWLVAKTAGHGMDFHPHGQDYIPQSMTARAELVFRLPKERPIRGRILDQQGKPVSGASVAVVSVSAFDSDASADIHLKKWVTEGFRRGVPPDAERKLTYAGRIENHSPFTAAANNDGRFEINEIGDGQLVTLFIHGNGIANSEILVLNRAGFDANPINKAVRENDIAGFRPGSIWQLYSPELSVVADAEKIIRGKVTDHEGKPRAGVRVVFSRPNKQELNPDYNLAVTGKDGRYEIRGARKHPGYMVECPPAPKAGLLACQAFAEDSPGFEPITIDLKCAKGVVITGTVKNKSTGEPVAAQLHVEVLATNPFVKDYPPFMNGASGAFEEFQTDKTGRFRIVTIPGPVIVMATNRGRNHREEFKPVVADPNYPECFYNEFGSLHFYGYEGIRGFVQGCWCKVLEPKKADTELTVNVEMEPASKMSVKVVDSEGQGVTDTLATGITHVNYAYPTPFLETDTLTVCNVGPKEGRLVAVVQEKRKLVGSATVTADAKNPIVMLGAGGSVTGRVIDANGKPIAGLRVNLVFKNRAVSNAFDGLKRTDFLTTNEMGEFRVDNIFPGQEFRVVFFQGKKEVGPDFQNAPKYSVAKHNDILKLGDLKVEITKEVGEE